MVTSNHIHLLVADDGQPETIFKTMQLIAGRTGQEYNQSRGFVDQVALCPGEAYNFKYK